MYSALRWVIHNTETFEHTNASHHGGGRMMPAARSTHSGMAKAERTREYVALEYATNLNFMRLPAQHVRPMLFPTRRHKIVDRPSPPLGLLFCAADARQRGRIGPRHDEPAPRYASGEGEERASAHVSEARRFSISSGFSHSPAAPSSVSTASTRSTARLASPSSPLIQALAALHRGNVGSTLAQMYGAFY